MQKKYVLTVLASGIAMALTSPIHAKDSGMPVIDITGEAPENQEASPSSTNVSDQQLQTLPSATSNTADLLNFVPGVSLQGAGGVSSLPTIRGLADDRLRIKVDGMDLISACGNHMNPPLSYIDPSNIASATVFAGISPVSVGGDSIGGAILVDSPDPVFAKSGQGLLTEGEAGAFYRSNGDANGGNITATVASENVSLTYRASTTQADNYKAGDDFKPAGLAAAGRGWLDGDEVGSSYYDSFNQSLALGLRHENHLFEVKLGAQDIDEQGYPNQRMDMTGNDSTQINLRYKGDYNWGQLEARAYREHTKHAMQFGDDKLFWYGNGTTLPDGTVCDPVINGMMGCAAGMPMDTEGDNRGLTIRADIPLNNRDLLRVGAEGQRYELDDYWEPSGRGMSPNTFWNINNGERDRLATFAEWEAQWDEKLLTQLGLRYEKVDMNAGDVQGYSSSFSGLDATDFNAADRDITDNNIDLTALARYTIDANRTVEVGFARKTRSPNLYERYTWSTHGMAMRMINLAGDGNGYVGNINLEPETAHTLSTTLDWHDAAQQEWGLKVTPYITYVKDYIDAARCSSATTRQTSGTSCTDANLTAQNSYVYLQFVNQSARLYGMDISGHMPLVKGTRYGDFTASGLLNYVRGKNRDTDDNLYNIMPLNLKLAVVQNLGNWTNTAEAELVDAKTDVSATRNELETNGYGLLHLRTSYSWKQARFDIGVENVFDRFYNHPLGGAYTGQGKTMSGNGMAWGTPVPGMGRSIYTGVNIKF